MNDLAPVDLASWGWNPQTIKFALSSLIQLFVGIAVTVLTYRIAVDKRSREEADLKLKLYNMRFDAYEGFRDLIGQCRSSGKYEVDVINAFFEKTQRIEFLFGAEIVAYKDLIFEHAETIANLTKINEGRKFPLWQDQRQPTTLELEIYRARKELKNWFADQVSVLSNAFSPYLDFSRTAVEQGQRVKAFPRAKVEFMEASHLYSRWSQQKHELSESQEPPVT